MLVRVDDRRHLADHRQEAVILRLQLNLDLGGANATRHDALEKGAERPQGAVRPNQAGHPIGRRAGRVHGQVGVPADVGEASRRSNLDAIIRAQGSAGPFIVGVSHIRTSPYQPGAFVRGLAVFTGLDVRWMQGGVQLRGEWLTGQPFNGTTTTGWYADAIVHRVAMGPVTVVGRFERLDYDVRHPFDLHTRRQTIGARVRMVEGLSAELNVLHQSGQLAGAAQRAVDVGVTYTMRMSHY